MKQVIYKTLIFIILTSFLVIISAQFVFAESKSGEVVIEQSSGRILHEKNANIQMPMASTTKIMTAMITLENVDVNDLVVIPNEAQGVEGSSIYLKAGDTYTVKDLLYGLMLRSGNDSAVALAIHVAGSLESFTNLMNRKAYDLGAYNTNFTNPHGLHDENHYTTARDLAIITANAFNHSLFKQIVSAKSYNLKGTIIYNKNKLLTTYDGADGVKTGYTTKSGRCLVSSSTRNNMQVISVVLNCYDMWERSKTLMNDAHKNYTMTKVIDKTEIYRIPIDNGCVTEIQATAGSDKYYPLKNNEHTLLSYKTNPISLSAPIYKGETCGNTEVYLDNCLIFKENIYTIDNIKKKSIMDWLIGLN